MPDVGVERHVRGLSEETRRALDTILDIENAETEVTLPSMEEIDAEETESERLKAERKALFADEQAALKASRVSVRDRFGRSGATGKRKTAVARVTLWPGTGEMVTNKKYLDDAFPDVDHRGWMLKPFLVTNTMGLFDVRAIVRGGGKSGQAQAVRHGIAKALQLYEPAFRPALKKAGMLTRDSRIVERKKPGRKKARKAFQWVKR
jgi:small subunit ribosomal protein S9